MLLSLCTYSVIIKMIDRNLSEVIDPSHCYYLWDLVLLILYKISFLTNERYFSEKGQMKDFEYSD